MCSWQPQQEGRETRGSDRKMKGNGGGGRSDVREVTGENIS